MVLCLKIHAYLSLIRLLRSLVLNKGIICMPYKGSKELAYDKALIKKTQSVLYSTIQEKQIKYVEINYTISAIGVSTVKQEWEVK